MYFYGVSGFKPVLTGTPAADIIVAGYIKYFQRKRVIA